MSVLKKSRSKSTNLLAAGLRIPIKSAALILCLAITTHCKAAGKLELKFGGWSHHGNSFEADDYDYHENHKGFGAEYVLYEAKSSPVVGFWTMTDSLDKRMLQGGVGYRYRPDLFKGRVTAQLMGVVEKRGIRNVNIDTGDTYSIERKTQFSLIPYIQIDLAPKFGLAIDFVYAPRIKQTDVETFFMRISLNTKPLLNYMGGFDF